jgi:hypothetical protein
MVAIHRYNPKALMVAELSNDATYAEVPLETFGARERRLEKMQYGRPCHVVVSKRFLSFFASLRMS